MDAKPVEWSIQCYDDVFVEEPSHVNYDIGDGALSPSWQATAFEVRRRKKIKLRRLRYWRQRKRVVAVL